MTKSNENQSNGMEAESDEQPEYVETGTRVEFWIREDTPYCVHDVQERTYERLQCLQEAGRIASVTSHLWNPIETTPKKTSQEHTAVYRERLSEFKAWANEHSRSLTPGFKTRPISSLFAEEEQEVIVPPMLCLAVYKNDKLRSVFPNADGDCVHTVGDGLDRLESETDGSSIGGVTA